MSPMTPAVAGPQWMPIRSRGARPPSGGWRPIASSMASASRPVATAPSRPAAVEAGRRHVAVADGLDLLDAVALAQPVEDADQLIEEIDDLLGRQVMRRFGEADEIGEHHAERLDAIGDALLARFQALGDRRRHDRADERVGAVVLCCNWSSVRRSADKA